MNPQVVFLFWLAGVLFSAIWQYYRKYKNDDVLISELKDWYFEFDKKYQATGVVTAILGLIGTTFFSYYNSLPTDYISYFTVFLTSSGLLFYFNKFAKWVDNRRHS